METNYIDKVILKTIRQYIVNFFIDNNEVKGKQYQIQLPLYDGMTVEFDFGWKHKCFQKDIVPEFWVENVKLYYKGDIEVDKPYLTERLNKPIIEVELTTVGNSIYALRYNGTKIEQYKFYSFYGISDDFVRKLEKLDYGEFFETNVFVYFGGEFDNS